jgi:hypothetical protein
MPLRHRLPPPRVLLRLALLKLRTVSDVQRIFDEY